MNVSTFMLFYFFYSWRGVVFYSPLVGFSLLVFEVS